MPEEGVELTPKAKLLSTDEIITLATLFVKVSHFSQLLPI